MCTIKRVGRWGDFSPSAFYLLNIINDQSLFFTKVFRKHWYLTAVLQYLKMHKCCSYVKNLELDRDQGLLWEGGCSCRTEELCSGQGFKPFPRSPIFTGRSIPVCQLSHIAGSDLHFSFLHLHPARAAGPSPARRSVPVGGPAAPGSCPSAPAARPPALDSRWPRAAARLVILLTCALVRWSESKIPQEKKIYFFNLKKKKSFESPSVTEQRWWLRSAPR